jgi:hypothetical protein
MHSEKCGWHGRCSKTSVDFRWRVGIAAVGLVLVFRTETSRADWDDTLECRGHLVNVGETLRGVLLECGSPTLSKHHVNKSPRAHGRVDEWTYERYGSFPRVLIFQNELLTSITAISGFRE